MLDQKPASEGSFMTRTRTQEEPYRQKGITFHLHWPSWEQELVSGFHQLALHSST